jgi:phosphohistidine phosphatase
MCAKRLFLIRHAKSSWKDADLPDYERPLNKRGKRDAPLMAELMKKKLVKPDMILTSFAERAKNTALIFAYELEYPENKIKIDERLYEAMSKDLLNVINEIDSSIKVLLLFGHNPGLTTLHNFICDKYIENIPTCGVTEYEYDGEWSDLSGEACRLVSFEYPKKYFHE